MIGKISLVLVFLTAIIFIPYIYPEQMESITDLLKHQVESNNSPAVQYAFFNDDSILFEFAHGWKNVKNREQADAGTTYNLFSITKTFTAVAILQLAQQGKLTLDKPASDYLPGFPYPNNITIRQLLNHTSGIPNPVPLKWIHLTEEQDSFDSKIFFDSLFSKHSKLSFAPGTKFAYSNLGYVLLGRIIEAVSSMPYEDYIKKNIFDACGINYPDLGFRINNATHATGYHNVWAVSYPLLGLILDRHKYMGDITEGWRAFHFININGAPYGGMVGSRDGLIRYAMAILRKDTSLLNTEYYNILFEGSKINGKSTGMSSSWFSGMLNGEPYFAHAGGGGGYYVELRLYPQLQFGSVVLFNHSGMRDERFLDRTDAFLLKEFATEKVQRKKQAV